MPTRADALLHWPRTPRQEHDSDARPCGCQWDVTVFGHWYRGFGCGGGNG